MVSCASAIELLYHAFLEMAAFENFMFSLRYTSKSTAVRKGKSPRKAGLASLAAASSKLPQGLQETTNSSVSAKTDRPG